MRLQKAFAEVQRLIDAHPKDITYLILLGDLYLDSNRDEDAWKVYQHAGEIEPDNAEKIYKEVCKDYEYSQEIKDQADAYGKMEPASAAAILSEMTNDLTLVAKILDSMQTSKSALILQNMKPTTAAQVTTKMTAMKNK